MIYLKLRFVSTALSLFLLTSNIVVATNQGTPVQENIVQETAKEENLDKSEAVPQEVYISGSIDTGEVISENAPDKVVSIASTTKVMTYLVVRDLIAGGKGSLTENVLISRKAANTEGSTFNLKEGDEVSVALLLDSIMIVSANDSCVALAEHFAGSTEEFVKLMNEKAAELHMETAEFYTVNGLPSEDDKENKMTPRELFNLSAHVMRTYPDVLEVTKKEKLDVPERDFSEPNSNTLLGKLKGIDGLKTGFTDSAGRCLIATGKKSEDQYRIATVVMGTDSIERRDDLSLNLMKDMYDNYEKKLVYEKGKVLDRKPLNDSRFVNIDVAMKEDFYAFVKKDEQIKTEIMMMKEVKTPIKVGDTVGKLIVTYGSNRREVDLTSSEDVGRIKLVGLWIKGFIDSFK